MSLVGLAGGDIVRHWGDAEASGLEPIVVLDSLVEFLDDLGFGAGEPEIESIGAGVSNITLRVRRGDVQLILRRPPRGPLPPSAHDVIREARIQKHLATHAPVPEILAVCEDDAVIGAPFYLMKDLGGTVIDDELPPRWDEPRACAAIGEQLIDALAEVHAVDLEASGLDRLARPAGYLERQLDRLGTLWSRNATAEVPEVDRIAGWLRANLPDSGPTTLVHGDYRLGNVLFEDTAQPRLVAILDWEMATLGDPLADLGYLCTMWVEPDDEPVPWIRGAVTTAPGFPSRAEIVERYRELTGRAVEAIAWYEVLAYWKAMIFMEGNYRRVTEGSVHSTYLQGMGKAVREMAVRVDRRVFG